jgi:hypothetical protein
MDVVPMDNDPVWECRELMARHMNCGFVLDAEWADRIGGWFGVNGAIVALDLILGTTFSTQAYA